MTTVKAGTSPKITMYVPTLAANAGTGSLVGMTYRVYSGSKLVAVAQPTATINADESVAFVANFKPVKGQTYTVTSQFNNANGFVESGTATVVGA